MAAPQLEKVNQVIKEYTDHEYVYASLLAVAGIFSILVFSGPMLIGV